MPVRDERGAIGRWFGACADIEDAVAAIRRDPSMADGDELAALRAERALERLAAQLGGISGALRAGPPDGSGAPTRG